MTGTGGKLTVSGIKTVVQHRAFRADTNAVAAFRTAEGQFLNTLGIYAGGDVQRIGNVIGAAGEPYTGQQNGVIGDIGRNGRAEGDAAKNNGITAGIGERDICGRNRRRIC